MAAPQQYTADQYSQPQIRILSQRFEQDPNTGSYEYSYEQDNGQSVSIASPIAYSYEVQLSFSFSVQTLNNLDLKCVTFQRYPTVMVPDVVNRACMYVCVCVLLSGGRAGSGVPRTGAGDGQPHPGGQLPVRR